MELLLNSSFFPKSFGHGNPSHYQPRSAHFTDAKCTYHSLSTLQPLSHPFDVHTMDANSSRCSENNNSTDCLLRALLQLLKEQQEAADAKIDWDPISFTFTLLIGLIAIAFALATILQAIFAAGKGRRRTSHLAIGKWFQKTTRKWDWSEMNFRFMASTPILREETVLFMIVLRKSIHGDERREIGNFNQETIERSDSSHAPLSPDERRERQERHLRVQNSASQRPFAAWLEFFGEVGLDQLDIQAWDGSVREVAADYLPDDLVAAPAYAQIGAIVAVAATAGIEKLDIDQQNYPILLGQGFQVDFRDHPALGVVGAYSRYDEANKHSRTLNLEKLRSAMRHGRGIFRSMLATGLKDNLSTETTPRRLIERWSLIQTLNASSQRHSKSNAFTLKQSAIPEVYLPLIFGLVARTPRTVPALFPTAAIEVNFSLTAVALNGKYWAEARFDSFSKADILDWPRAQEPPTWNGFTWYSRQVGRSHSNPDICEYHLKLSEEKDADEQLLPASFETEMNEIVQRLRASQVKDLERVEAAAAEAAEAKFHIAKAPDQPHESAATYESATTSNTLEDATASHENIRVTSGYLIVLQMCLKVLQKPRKLEEWFYETSSDARRILRCMLLEQIKEVDRWLLEREPDIEGRIVMLCNTSIVLLHAEEMIKDRLLDEAEPETTLGHFARGETVEKDQWQSTNRDRTEGNTAKEIHLNTLQVIRNLVDSLDENQLGVRKLSNLVISNDSAHSSRLWDRLSALVVYHSKEEPNWPLWDRFHENRNNRLARDIDDVIIFRCLMTIILFRTAADSSKILESGLWDKVVPIV